MHIIPIDRVVALVTTSELMKVAQRGRTSACQERLYCTYDVKKVIKGRCYDTLDLLPLQTARSLVSVPLNLG